jgi:hypothetical protein
MCKAYLRFCPKKPVEPLCKCELDVIKAEIGWSRERIGFVSFVNPFESEPLFLWNSTK